jgi:hypothetical protein
VLSFCSLYLTPNLAVGFLRPPLTGENPIVENNKTWCSFLKDLGLELVRAHMNERLTIPVPIG